MGEGLGREISEEENFARMLAGDNSTQSNHNAANVPQNQTLGQGESVSVPSTPVKGGGTLSDLARASA